MRAAEGEGRRRIVGDDGQATAELAMVLPLVAVLLVLVLQVGVVLRDQVMVVHAAREAARAAVVTESAGDRAGAATQAAERSGAFPAGNASVHTQLVDGGERLRATVRHVNRTDLPLVGALLPDVPLSASATMRVEQP
jgi:Flp pilus assembly protein TadG